MVYAIKIEPSPTPNYIKSYKSASIKRVEENKNQTLRQVVFSFIRSKAFHTRVQST